MDPVQRTIVRAQFTHDKRNGFIQLLSGTLFKGVNPELAKPAGQTSLSGHLQRGTHGATFSIGREPHMNSEQQLIVLLVHVAVAASVASVLSRLGPFMRMLLREQRTTVERTQMALFYGAVFGAGVMLRVVSPAYQAADIALAGALMAGLTAGYWTGLLSGVLMSIPAMFHGEWMSMPMLAGFGLLGGLLRDVAPDPEEIWRFSPFFDLLAGYRVFRKGADLKRSAFQLLFVVSIVFAAFIYEAVSQIFGRRVLQALAPGDGLELLAAYLTVLACVAVPLKIWQSARTERMLEAQNRLLVEARLAALTNQINPHFLFNTLNSIASLVRVNPEQARGVIYNLSSILRRLLRKVEPMAVLREELAFIDDYLAIELVRFGEKLRFIKDIDPAVLDHPVPSMLLQPIVENSIKHGIANHLEGGRIVIRARVVEGLLRVVVEDDGAGMTDERLAQLLGSGVGVSNVNERLRVIYGDAYRLSVESQPGQGTRTEIDLPLSSPTTPRADRDRELATLAARPKAR